MYKTSYVIMFYEVTDYTQHKILILYLLFIEKHIAISDMDGLNVRNIEFRSLNFEYRNCCNFIIHCHKVNFMNSKGIIFNNIFIVQHRALKYCIKQTL
jgi:hypothetical protein